ncbi:MAG: CRP/FNR family cyclic AMP-dependent transcriptional regulator [Limisphaerales bacterium]|jgi:CRP/FNR family cyclic AMP-dependent transcriptional regulator
MVCYIASTAIIGRFGVYSYDIILNVHYLDRLRNQDLTIMSSVQVQTGSDIGLHALLKGQSSSSYKKGEYIFKSHDSPDCLFFLEEGRVKLGANDSSGKEIIKSIIYPGELFAEGRLFESMEAGDFAVAAQTSTVYAIQIEGAQKMIEQHPSLALKMLQSIGIKMNSMSRRLQSLVFQDARSRIIYFIKETGLRRGEKIGFEIAVCNFALTHQDMANLTGTSRQTVTMVLNELKEAKLIHIDRRNLLIRDFENLA